MSRCAASGARSRPSTITARYCGIEGVAAGRQDLHPGLGGKRVCAGDGRGLRARAAGRSLGPDQHQHHEIAEHPFSLEEPRIDQSSRQDAKNTKFFI